MKARDSGPAGGVRFRVNLGDNCVAVWHGVVFWGLSLVPRTGSSSGKAIFEDEMGPNPVSSSGKAVYEEEMGLMGNTIVQMGGFLMIGLYPRWALVPGLGITGQNQRQAVDNLPDVRGDG